MRVERQHVRVQWLRLTWLVVLAVAFLNATDGPAWANEPADPVAQRTESTSGVWLAFADASDDVVQRRVEVGCKSLIRMRVAAPHGSLADLYFSALNRLRPTSLAGSGPACFDARAAIRCLRAGARNPCMTSDDPLGHVTPLSA